MANQPLDSYGVGRWLGYLWPDEIDELKRLAQSLRRRPVVVNIGAGGGTSGLAFLESRRDLILYTIDIQDEANPLGCLAGERAVVRGSGVVHAGRWFQIWGDSKEVGQNWRGGPVDLVFVDGDHTPEGCSGDIEAWLPHIRPGGVMALHDYKKGEGDKPWFGVDKAVDELLVDRYERISRVRTLVSFRI